MPSFAVLDSCTALLFLEQAHVVSVRDAAAPGAAGLLRPLIRRWQAGGCSTATFQLPVVQAVVDWQVSVARQSCLRQVFLQHINDTLLAARPQNLCYPAPLQWQFCRRFLIAELGLYILYLASFFAFAMAQQVGFWCQLAGHTRGAASSFCARSTALVRECMTPGHRQNLGEPLLWQHPKVTSSLLAGLRPWPTAAAAACQPARAAGGSCRAGRSGCHAAVPVCRGLRSAGIPGWLSGRLASAGLGNVHPAGQ